MIAMTTSGSIRMNARQTGCVRVLTCSEMAVSKMVDDNGLRCPRPRGAGETKRAGQDARVAIRSVA
jgi:hypothetical protein